MQLSFFSPRAIYLLASSLALCAMGVTFTAMLYSDPQEAPNTIGKLVVVALLNLLFFWAAFKPWKAFLIEYRYGVSLSQFQPGSKLAQDALVELKEPALVSSFMTLNEPAKTDRLSYPWPSMITSCLIIGLLVLFLTKGPIPAWYLLAGTTLIYAMHIYTFRPWLRWCQCLKTTQSFQETKSSDRHLLPLKLPFTGVSDSNFYRLHASHLKSLGFELIYQQQDQHFFTRRGSSSIVTLGRIQNRNASYPFISFASIDDTGRVFKSHSYKPMAKILTDAHPMLSIQILDAQNTIEAWRCHQQFLKTNRHPHCRIVDANLTTNIIEHLHEVTVRARIRHFNEKEISFA